MGFTDNFSITEVSRTKLSDSKELVLSINEHKTKGTLAANIRFFITSDRYTGFSKDGIMIPIESIEQIDDIKENFISFFNKISELL